MIRFIIYLFVCLAAHPLLFGQPVEITNSIVVGGVTSNSSRFWIKTSVPAKVNIELSLDNNFTSKIYGQEISTLSENGNTGIIEVNGLQSNTKYFYRAGGENVADSLERYFYTFPEFSNLLNFSFAFGSCQQSGNFLPSDTEELSVFDEIIKHDVRFFLQLGDWGYPDTTDSFPEDNNFFSKNYDQVKQSYWNKFNKEYPMDQLLRKMPVDYVYDDHDFMNNNSSSLTTSYYIPSKPFSVFEIENPSGARENSIKGYKENMPGYPLENETRGIYHRFRYGDVEFFALDLRAQKSSSLVSFAENPTTNKWEFNPTAGHSIVGRDDAIGDGESQMNWFLNSLKNSTATWKFIMSSVPFNIGQREALDLAIYLQDFTIPIDGAPEGATAIAAAFELADGWSGFPEDSEMILDFIDKNKIKNVIVLSGDSHNAAIDDGTNAGLPEIMAGNLDITNSRTVTLFENYGIKIWNQGGHGITTQEFNDAFGKVDVFGDDSVRLNLIDEYGDLFATYTLKSEMVTNVVHETMLNGFTLSQNFPNPFNPRTKIDFTIGSKNWVTLKVYNVLGQEIETLVDSEFNSGNHSVDFNAEILGSGIYIYTLSAGENRLSKKMIVLK